MVNAPPARRSQASATGTAPRAGAKGTSASVTVNFSDVGSLDSQTVRLVWDDGTPDTVLSTGGSARTAAHTYAAPGVYSVGVDVVEEIIRMAKRIQTEYPNPMFFGGQLVFSRESVLHRALHNYTIFSVHRRLHFEGIPVMIMPIRVY